MKRRSFLKIAGAASVAASLSPADALAASAGACNRSLRGRKVRVDDGWDVIVIGGGPSGCTAAVAAARGGAKTLLIESTGVLGGMGTSGLLNAWCPFSDGERIVYKGLAERVFRESKKGVPHVKGDNWVPINCEQLKIIYDDLVLSYGVKVLFFSTMAAVEMKNDRTVDCVIVANKAGLTAYKAKTYIDCTGDGDLAAWAGADFVMGDEDGAVQAGSLCFDVANVNQKAYRTLGSWRQDSPIYQIAGNPEYPLIHDAHLNDKVLAPGVIGFNAGHIEVDSTDPESVTAAMMEGRKIAAELHRALKDLRPEAFKDSFLVATASSMGIRESRRVLCDYTFVTEDWVQRRDFDDNIGRNCYYIDVHKKDFGGNAIPRYKKGESHGIPYRCLTPIGLDNVIVAGRCISTDQATLGSLRVMPPAMVTGEAAGVAASLACRSSKPDFHSVDVKNLQEILLREGQLLYL